MSHASPVLALSGTDAHVLSVADGSTVLRLSSGRFLRVQEPPPGFLEALADESQGRDETVKYVKALNDTIASRDTSDAEARWPPHRTSSYSRAGLGPGGEATGSLRSTLWKFVPATGRISEHTVLGYDASYMPAETVIR